MGTGCFLGDLGSVYFNRGWSRMVADAFGVADFLVFFNCGRVGRHGSVCGLLLGDAGEAPADSMFLIWWDYC